MLHKLFPIVSEWQIIYTTMIQVFFLFSEFMLGDDILVAPVIQQGRTTRDIYLPKGKWTDGNTGAIITGRIWLKNYRAPLDVLPYFIKTT
jgi:myogenesis-regulating glycosidase